MLYVSVVHPIYRLAVPIPTFLISVGCSIAQLVGYLELVAHAGNPTDYEDGITFVP
jgi:hypothetical protein